MWQKIPIDGYIFIKGNVIKKIKPKYLMTVDLEYSKNDDCFLDFEGNVYNLGNRKQKSFNESWE